MNTRTQDPTPVPPPPPPAPLGRSPVPLNDPVLRPPASGDQRTDLPPPPSSPAPPSSAPCMLSSVAAGDAHVLLAERARLSRELAALDEESERLTRAVQRVGGPSSGARPFTGAAPMLVSSSNAIEGELDRLTAEMNRLVAGISSHELALQDLERGDGHPWLTLVAVIVVLAAIAAGIVFVVR